MTAELLIGILLGLCFFTGITFLTGHQIYYEKSTSMTPSLKKGDLLLVRKNKEDRYEIGDIVTADITIGQEKICLTHRIVRILSDGRYVTKGDANTSVDGLFLKPEQIKGKVIGNIPHFGTLCLGIRKNILPILLLILGWFYYKMRR